MTKVGRRRFLRAAAAGAAAASVIRPGSWWGRAHAQPTVKPKLLIFATSSGALVGPTGDAGRGYGGWLPNSLHGGSGRAEVSTSDGPLPDILQPLERHADQMLAIDGLRGSGSVGAHQQAAVILTGGLIQNNELPRSAGGDGDFYAADQSIDHAIAEAIGSRVLGMAYRIDGFQLGEGYLSHTRGGTPFIPVQNHIEAHERVFAGLEAPTDTSLDRRRHVLESIRGDVGRLRGRLPRRDHATLDEHIRSVDRVEGDLEPGLMSCTPPPAPESFDARNDSNVPRLIRSYMTTMTQAMACGYTQVGFIQVGNLEGSTKPRWDEFGISTNYNEHAISHKFMGEDGAGSDGLSRADAIQLAVRTQRAYASLIAELLDQLEATPDVDGTPMLRNTIVLHVKPMGRNHDRNHLFWQVFGGQNLGIRTGRFLRLSRDGGSDHHINDLHVALAQAMGATGITQFGLPGQNRSALDLS